MIKLKNSKILKLLNNINNLLKYIILLKSCNKNSPKFDFMNQFIISNLIRHKIQILFRIRLND